MPQVMYGKSPEAVDKQAVGNDTVVYSFQDKRFPPYTRSVVQTGLAQPHVFIVISAFIRLLQAPSHNIMLIMGGPSDCVVWEHSGFLHHVTLTGLEPSTRYYYQIGAAHENQDGPTPLFHFDTLPAVGTLFITSACSSLNLPV